MDTLKKTNAIQNCSNLKREIRNKTKCISKLNINQQFQKKIQH